MIELNYAEIYKEYKNGASIRKLANKYNCAATTISNGLKEYCRENEIEFLHDYKSKLQELVQTVKKSIIYEVIDEKGPAHNKTFTSIVKIDGIIMGKGTAGSKKASEQEAAKDALSKEAKVEK